MRIETSDEYAWRIHLYDNVGDMLDEPTQSGAIDTSCESTRQMFPALVEAIEHPDMTEELAEVLSTPTVELTYRVEADLDVNPIQRA